MVSISIDNVTMIEADGETERPPAELTPERLANMKVEKLSLKKKIFVHKAESNKKKKYINIYKNLIWNIYVDFVLVRPRRDKTFTRSFPSQKNRTRSKDQVNHKQITSISELWFVQ